MELQENPLGVFLPFSFSVIRVFYHCWFLFLLFHDQLHSACFSTSPLTLPWATTKFILKDYTRFVLSVQLIVKWYVAFSIWLFAACFCLPGLFIVTSSATYFRGCFLPSGVFYTSSHICCMHLHNLISLKLPQELAIQPRR